MLNPKLNYDTAAPWVAILPNTLQQKMLENTIFISRPPEEVWKCLTDGDAISIWDKDVEDVAYNSELSLAETDVQGSYRWLYLHDGTFRKQIITDWRPGSVLGYTTIEGQEVDGLQMHIGLFRLYPSADGTEVQWLNYIEYTNPLVLHRITVKCRRHLSALQWVVENVLNP